MWDDGAAAASRLRFDPMGGGPQMRPRDPVYSRDENRGYVGRREGALQRAICDLLHLQRACLQLQRAGCGLRAAVRPLGG